MDTRTDAVGPTAPSYSDYLDADAIGAPAFLRTETRADLGTAPLATDRYTSQAFFDREAAHLWPRVWQMACREEDLPTIGDALPYQIIDTSLLLVRAASGRIRAFYNVCPHRGRKLLLSPAHLEDIRCPFHGFRWTLDGALRAAPCRADFAHLPDSALALSEVRVETWGGFVFINMDPSAASLLDYLGVLPAHFDRWRLEDRWKAVHVGKRIACNWKVAQEAFMESYHVIATHPQILEFCADANSRYDILSPNVNRNLTAFGAPSPHVATSATAAGTFAGMLGMLGRAPRPMTEGPPRMALGALARASLARAYGGDWSHASDAELLDAIVYNVFPNFSPWGGFAPNIVYRWRPDGRDVDACLMEVMILKPVVAGEARPPSVPMRLLGEHERWSDVAELPILGPVIDQDMQNMPYVQQGLKSSGTGLVQLAGYQESRIRHFHARIDAYLAD